jgi:hypothetical protein
MIIFSLTLYKCLSKTIKEKKKEVLTLLSNTNDGTLIEEVYDMLHPADTIDEINIQQLPKQIQEKVNKAIDDYRNGNYITHVEMKQKLQQWLTK